MRVLASYNIKGGVGKTASVVNLAYLAAATGARTLVWDLDPQGAATYYFRTKSKVRGGGARALVRGKSEVDDVVRSTEYPRLDVMPADFSYRHLDVDLDGTKHSSQRLARLVKPLAADYDYVFFDCAPSLSLVSENVFHAADALLVPTIPTTLSLRSLDQLSEFLTEPTWKDLAVFPFFTMVDRRKKMHRDLVESLTRGHTGILASWVPSASDVERMGEHRAPLPAFAPRSPSTFAYAALWGELRARMMSLPDHHPPASGPRSSKARARPQA